MTSHQRQLVRHSFDAVRDLSGPMAVLFYGKLFELDPSACAQRAPFLGYVDVEPAMAPLLQDPACRALLRQHGFRAGG